MGNQGDVQVAHTIMTDANGFPAAVFRIAKGAIRASVIAAEVAGHINRSLQKIRCGPELSQMMVVGFAKGSPVAFTGRHCRTRTVEFFGAGDENRTRDSELAMLLALATELRPPRISNESRRSPALASAGKHLTPYGAAKCA